MDNIVRMDGKGQGFCICDFHTKKKVEGTKEEKNH